MHPIIKEEERLVEFEDVYYNPTRSNNRIEEGDTIFESDMSKVSQNGSQRNRERREENFAYRNVEDPA